MRLFGGRALRKCQNSQLQSDGILRIYDNETVEVLQINGGNPTTLVQEQQTDLDTLRATWQDSTWLERLNRSENTFKKLRIAAVASGIETDRHLEEMKNYIAKMTKEEPFDFWEKWTLRVGLTVTFLLAVVDLFALIGCAYGASGAMTGGRIPIRSVKMAKQQPINSCHSEENCRPQASAPLLTTNPPCYEADMVDYRKISTNPYAEMDEIELELYRRWEKRLPGAYPGEISGLILNTTRPNGIWFNDQVVRAMVHG